MPHPAAIKMQKMLAAQSVGAIKVMVGLLLGHEDKHADIVLAQALEALKGKMVEAEFVAYCNGLEA